jgi:hypothetical protein
MRRGTRIGALLLVLGALPGCRDAGDRREDISNPLGPPPSHPSVPSHPVAGHDRTVWPVPRRPLSSPFGPRLKASEGYRYDFHRGIDIPGNRGEPVVAMAGGEVFRTYREGDRSSPYPEAGNVVVLRHRAAVPIPFHGRAFTRYYSLYFHLDAIEVDMATPGGPYSSIAAGERLGTLGQSGTTTFDHLHFEIRIGTTCSREYQIAHPDEPCASTFGATPQDPHVNPLRFLPYPETDRFEATILRQDPLTVRVRCDREELDFDAIRVVRGVIVKLVDFDDRTGIDARNIDSPTAGGVTIQPARFNARSPAYEIVFEFSGLGGCDMIEIRDIWGKGFQVPTPPLHPRSQISR